MALQLATRLELEQLGMSATEAARFHLSSRPSARFHGDVVACVGDVKSQLSSGGKIFLTAASTGELERYADICREYEVPYVLGESESAAAGFTAEGALESAGLGAGARTVWRGNCVPGCQADHFRKCGSVRRCAFSRSSHPQNSHLGILQRFCRSEARRFRGARGPRHWPVRRFAAD